MDKFNYDPAAIRFEWADAINRPFDSQSMKELYDRYQIALRREANWKKLYEIARNEYHKEIHEYRAELRNKLLLMSKKELSELTGLSMERNTKNKMINWEVDFSDEVEDEHKRVKRMWAAMTEEEKQAT